MKLESQFNKDSQAPDNEVQGLIGALKAWLSNPHYNHRHYVAEKNFSATKKMAKSVIGRRDQSTIGVAVSWGKAIINIQSRVTACEFRIKYL